MANERCIERNTLNEMNKGRASSSKLKASAKTLGEGGNGKRGGGTGVEEGSNDLWCLARRIDYSDKNSLERRWSVSQGNCLVLHIIKSILECSYLALRIWLFF